MGNVIFAANQQPYNWQAILDATLGTAQINIFNINAQRAQVVEIYMTNTDAIDHVVDLLMATGGSPTFFGSVTVPAGSGVGTVPCVLALTSIQGAGQAGIAVDPFTMLYLANEVSATVAGSVFATALGQAF